MTDSTYSAEHKVPTFDVLRLTNKSPEFYGVVGPFLSRREIVAELGQPVWDEDSKLWLVAKAGGGETLGLVAVRDGREICSFYVTPGSRGRLVGTALLHQAVTTAGLGKELRATATDASLELFTLFGFVETGTRGRYHLMRRPADG